MNRPGLKSSVRASSSRRASAQARGRKKPLRSSELAQQLPELHQLESSKAIADAELLGAVATVESEIDPENVEVKSEARQKEDALVALAKKGDTRAFEFLVVKHQNKLINVLNRIVGEADAHDVAQIAFLKAWRALPGFQGNSQFYTWLYRIGVNCAKNYLVSRSRRPSYQDIDIADAELFGHTHELSDGGTPENEVLAEEIREKVAASISTLPPDLRRAISLRELEGMSYEEIAEIMRCPVGTVRSRIFRAREAIDLVLQPLIA